MSTHCITRFVDCEELGEWPPNNLIRGAHLSNDVLQRTEMVYGKAREIVCAWRHHDGNPKVHGKLLKMIVEEGIDGDTVGERVGCFTYMMSGHMKGNAHYVNLMPAGTHHIGEHFTYVVYLGSRNRTALQVIVCRYQPDSGTSHRESIYFGPLEWFSPVDVEALAYPPESEEACAE